MTAFDCGGRVPAAPDLLAVLQRYVAAYPAFRMKPIGAPGSEARIEQDNLMALEDVARAAIAKAAPCGDVTDEDRCPQDTPKQSRSGLDI